MCEMGTVPSRQCSAWNRPVPKHLQTYGAVVGVPASDLWPLRSQARASRCFSGQRGQGGLVPGGDTGSESQTTTRKPIAGVQTLCREGAGAQGGGKVEEVALAQASGGGQARYANNRLSLTF